MYRGTPRNFGQTNPAAEANDLASVFGPVQAETILRSDCRARQLHAAERSLANLYFMVCQAQSLPALREVAHQIRQEYNAFASDLDHDLAQQQHLLHKMAIQAVLKNDTEI